MSVRKKRGRTVRIIVEKHPDGYIAYPLGIIKGAVVGEGETYDEALADAKSAIRFHIKTFGKDAFDDTGSPILEAFIAEAAIAV